MLNAAHLGNGDNLRLVRREYRASAAAAIRLLQQIEYDESYWRRLMDAQASKDSDDKPRR